MLAILRKELADYINSFRFMILFIIIIALSALALYSASLGIRGEGSESFIFLKLFTTEPQNMPLGFFFNYVNFIPLVFIPLFAIVLGFDAINRERNSGTISRILSQPVYRDSVINGKFLASLFVLAVIMLSSLAIIAGYGMRMIGIAPTSEEIIRIFFYFLFMLIYGAFWISLAILFSVLFRNMATSIIVSLALWLLLSFGIFVIGAAVSNDNQATLNTILNISPNYFFGNSSALILSPASRTIGSLTAEQSSYMIPNPLGLGQSLGIIWPYIVGLISLSAVCFAVSYIAFMKQEIRST
jgi:ABC-2 type transport system permease protein